MKAVLRGLIDGATGRMTIQNLNLLMMVPHRDSRIIHLLCEVLRRYRCLKTLRIGNVICNDRDWRQLCQSVCLVDSLKSLAVCGYNTHFYRAGRLFERHLRDLLTMSGLEELKLEQLDMSFVRDIEGTFAANQCVRSLSLELPDGFDEAIARRVLCGVQSNEHFQEISLKHFSWEPATEDALTQCLAGSSSIKRLNLMNHFNGAGSIASQVSSLIGTNQTNLEHFYIRESGLDDQFVLNLRTSTKLKHLRIDSWTDNVCCWLKVLSRDLLCLESLESLRLSSYARQKNTHKSANEVVAAMKQNVTLQRFHSNDLAAPALEEIKCYTIRNRFHQLIARGKRADVLKLTPILLEKSNHNPSYIFLGLQKLVDVVPFGSDNMAMHD